MITAVSPTTIDALDGSALNISGVNFAPINSDPTVHAQVFVGSVSCAVQFMSSSAILCLSARSQLIGPSNLTVLTWRTGIANESTSAGPDALNSQLSLAVAVNLSCPVNYYGLVGNFCSLCPVEAYCAGGLALPVALPGYYRVGITDFLQCSPAIACPGYVNDTSAQSQCAAGYSGTPCNTCERVRMLF